MVRCRLQLQRMQLNLSSKQLPQVKRRKNTRSNAGYESVFECQIAARLRNTVAGRHGRGQDAVGASEEVGVGHASLCGAVRTSSSVALPINCQNEAEHLFQPSHSPNGTTCNIFPPTLADGGHVTLFRRGVALRRRSVTLPDVSVIFTYLVT